MSDHNPNDRIYLRSTKPLDEMTSEEIKAFAEEMIASGFVARSIERHRVQGLTAVK